MSYDVVESNYETLEEVAKLLNGLCERIETMKTNVHRQAEDLWTNGWLGKGADAFRQEMTDDVLPRVTRLQEALGLASQLTNEIRALLEDADNSASSLFRR